MLCPSNRHESASRRDPER